MTRRIVVAAAGAAVCALVATVSQPAAADILISISKPSQRMSVLVDGTAKYNWLVSTGAARYTTPSGVYKPQWLAKFWRSKKYGNAPMPHSIFFFEGYAIHGTTEVRRLGRIASHGCVRLHPENAAKLYALVIKDMANTRVVVSNDVIEAPGEAPKPKKPSQHVAENAAGEELGEADIKLESVALALPESGALDDAPFAKTDVRGSAKPERPAREKVARVHRPGFHW